MYLPTSHPWAEGDNLGRYLETRGVSRREFVGFCAQMTAMLGLGELMTPRVAQALAAVKRPSVIWLSLQECTGCTESVLRTADPTIGDLVLDVVSLDFQENLMAAAGFAAEGALRDAMSRNAGQYLLVVTGSVPLNDGGIYTTIAGRPVKEILEEAAKGAAAVIAVGACAHWGNIQAARPNPTGAVGVSDIVKDKAVVNIAGCPPIGDVVTATIVHYLTFNKVPALDYDGRPLFAYGARIHDQCPRRANFDAGQFVEQFDDEAARKGWCLYHVGCKGPATFSPCPIFMWNSGTSWPIGAGHPCLGCTERNFWDTMTPFYGRLPDVAGFGVERYADTLGAALAIGATAGVAAHAIATGVHQVRERRKLPVIDDRGGKGAVMATTKVVIDPITRIEGHLRIEAQAENGKVTNAWATSTQFRGIEIVMQGRDPRDAWAFAQRICGVCTVVHAVASCRAVEDALDITIPPNANLIRNLIHGMQFVQDHVMHFYHLHALDWVDVVSALTAKPADTAALAKQLSPWPNNSETYFSEVQNRLKTFVGSGQLGIFANGYWGHPAYKLPPAVNLLAVAHYLEALDWQRDVIRVHTIFGGKNPHPNFLVGGMASAINLDSRMTINAVRLSEIHGMITRAQQFVEQVYLPDVLAIAGFYKEWAAIGGGTGNYLACGEFPETDVRDLSSLYFPRGIILERDLTKVWPYDHKQIQEYINSSWYEYAGGDNAGLHPWEGETKAKYTGPKTPWTYLQGEPKYSWMKAPRYEGRPMEVGPLARMLVAFASGHEEARATIKEVLDRLEVGPTALFSTLGRIAARCVETVLLSRKLNHWYDAFVNRIKGGDTRTFNGDKWEPATWPAKAQGYGYLDAPRGALGHWVQIEDQKIARYQCVVPSTWNCSPRDAKGQPGPYEAALMDHHPLVKPDQPIEILRTVHSFDPCMACGVHVLDASGNEVTAVRVQ